MSAGVLIIRAYGITDLQLVGPEWLATTRFDISANVPVDATKQQVSEMWKNLLTERFNLEVHPETKEVAQFDLLVAKNGPKLKPAVSGDGPPQMARLGRRRPDFTYYTSENHHGGTGIDFERPDESVGDRCDRPNR